MKKNKDFLLRFVFVIVIGICFVAASIIFTFSYFASDLEGPSEPPKMEITTAVLQLAFSDNSSTINASGILPGSEFQKTVVVTNDSSILVDFNFVWLSMLNDFSNNELVISATCVNDDGICDPVPEVAVPVTGGNMLIKESLEIEAYTTNTYTFTLRFIDTLTNQDYNQEMQMSGRIGISSSLEY